MAVNLVTPLHWLMQLLLFRSAGLWALGVVGDSVLELGRALGCLLPDINLFGAHFKFVCPFHDLV